MPALAKPRHEAFAQAIFAAILKGQGNYSQAQAYKAAGYNVTNGNSARACASRLLSFANGIGDRIRELQANAAKQTEESITKVTSELNAIMNEARQDQAHGAAVAAVMGKAKVLGLYSDKVEQTNKTDFSQAKDQRTIALNLLAQVGLTNPSEQDISNAMAANSAFLDTLLAISERAQGGQPQQ